LWMEGFLHHEEIEIEKKVSVTSLDIDALFHVT
jgi:hypothetical protein